MFVSQSSACNSEDRLSISSSALSIIKHKILSHTLQTTNCNSYIDISSDSESSAAELFLYEESYNSHQDQEYLPDMDSAQSEIVKKNKKYNLRSHEIKIITKEEYLKPHERPQPYSIMIEDSDPEPKAACLHKLEHVKVNFKEQIRGPITKKAKMESLFRRKNIISQKNKTHQINKALNKLRKQLA